MKLVTGILLVLALLAVRPLLLEFFKDRFIGDTGPTAGNCVSMLSSATEDQGGGNYIVGSIRNNCKGHVEKVTLKFRLEEERGKDTRGPEGLVYAYALKVEAGETRAFKSTQPVMKNSVFHLDTMVVY